MFLHALAGARAAVLALFATALRAGGWRQLQADCAQRAAFGATGPPAKEGKRASILVVQRKVDDSIGCLLRDRTVRCRTCELADRNVASDKPMLPKEPDRGDTRAV